MIDQITPIIEKAMKWTGVSIFFFFMPIVMLMIAPLLIFPFWPNGLYFSETLIAGFFLGFIFFMYFSVVDMKIDQFGSVDFGKFNSSKFIFSIFITPFIIGSLLNYFEKEITFNDFIFVAKASTDMFSFLTTIQYEQGLFVQYLAHVLPMVPVMLLTYIMIKQLIYWVFIGIGNIPVLTFDIFMQLQHAGIQ